MYRKSRIVWLLNSFKELQCPCGEAELVCLIWYPHHKKIRNLIYRNSAKSEQRKEAVRLINQSKPVCRNCASKIVNGLEPFIL